MQAQLVSKILQLAGVEYALIDQGLQVTHHSPGLTTWLEDAPESLQGAKISDVFPEFIGSEAYLQRILRGEEPSFRIDRIWRENQDGRSAYMTLEIHPEAEGLLLLVRDVTAEGMLEQRITQTRNELRLMSDRLQQTSARLDTVIRRFVPSAIVDEMLRDESKAQPGGLRREISVLFADLRNFTRWAEHREPEVVLTLLNHLWATVVAVAAEYGGTVNQFMGDGVMIMFNAPQELPEHALQALRCGRALANLSSDDSGLRFGVGVNTGPVVVGNIGAQTRLSYTAIGTTTNVAHRLQSIAQPGQVILGPRTQELVAGQVRCIPLDVVQLKGISTPVQVFAFPG